MESEGGTKEDRTASRSSLPSSSEGRTAGVGGATGYSAPPSPEGAKVNEEPLTVELLKQKEAEEEQAGTYTVADELVYPCNCGHLF